MSAAPEVLTYRDLESQMHDAVNMSDIACRLSERVHTGTTTGMVIMTDREWQALVFAICHTDELIVRLKNRWDEIHDSNVAAKKGGGASDTPEYAAADEGLVDHLVGGANG